MLKNLKQVKWLFHLQHGGLQIFGQNLKRQIFWGHKLVSTQVQIFEHSEYQTRFIDSFSPSPRLSSQSLRSLSLSPSVSLFISLDKNEVDFTRSRGIGASSHKSPGFWIKFRVYSIDLFLDQNWGFSCLWFRGFLVILFFLLDL